MRCQTELNNYLILAASYSRKIENLKANVVISEKKKMDMFEDSSPISRMDTKNVPLPPVPPPSSANKFKMQIGASQNRSVQCGFDVECQRWLGQRGFQHFFFSVVLESVFNCPLLECQMHAYLFYRFCMLSPLLTQ